jgi:chromosome segregation ATPase
VNKVEKEVSTLETKRDALQVEIKRLTAELDRLTGPSSNLAKSIDIFKSILEELKKSPTMVEAAINQVIIGMNGQIDKLKDANSNVGATNQELQKMQKTLSPLTGELSQAVKTLGDSVKVNTADLQRSTGEISKVANTTQTISASLSGTMQGFQQTGRELSQKATDVSQEIDKLKAITHGLQQTGDDLSQRVTEVSQPLNDLNTVAKDVQKARDSFIQVMDSLSKLINAFKSATDMLTSQSGELVGNTVQLKTSNAALSLRLQELEQTGNALKTTYDRLSTLLEEFAAAVPKSPNEENRKPN